MANRKEELDEFIAYRDKLADCRKNRSSETFFNDSAIHEEFVMKELFANAVESSPQIGTIYMYCGKMSAFRDAICIAVEEMKKRLKPNDDSNDEEQKQWEAFDPYAKMVAQMQLFFDSGGHLDVIVDERIDDIVNEKIWRNTLNRYFTETKQLSIYQLSINSGVEHFVVCGNAYRSELSHKDKTALCCFNDSAYADLLYSNFAFLQRSSRPLVL